MTHIAAFYVHPLRPPYLYRESYPQVATRLNWPRLCKEIRIGGELFSAKIVSLSKESK